jgi:DNA-binding NarL/FixJ family response regulator
MPCRLLLADDHELVRKNLREIIEFKTDCVIVYERKMVYRPSASPRNSSRI